VLRNDLTGPGGVAIDPAISQPYTHEVAAFLEHPLGATMGIRTGFVYKTIDNQTGTYYPLLPPEAYDTPFHCSTSARTACRERRTM
jgi:hypothetical protein